MLVHQLNVKAIPAKDETSLVNSWWTNKIQGCLINFTLDSNVYENVEVLVIGNLCAIYVPPPSLFMHLSSDCKPIAVKSRKHTKHDEESIKKETQRLLDEGIIKPSKSPWRAHVLVTKKPRKTQGTDGNRLKSNNKSLHRPRCLPSSKNWWYGE